MQRGETLVITGHQRPIVEVTGYRAQENLAEPSTGAFTSAGSSPSAPVSGVWESLLQAERDEQ